MGGLTSIFLGENSTYGNPVLKRLLAVAWTTEEVANDILGVISSSIELSQSKSTIIHAGGDTSGCRTESWDFQVFTHVVNFYLRQRSDVNAWKPSVKGTPTGSLRDYVAASVASVATTFSDENALRIRTLEGYVLEALRKVFFFTGRCAYCNGRSSKFPSFWYERG